MVYRGNRREMQHPSEGAALCPDRWFVLAQCKQLAGRWLVTSNSRSLSRQTDQRCTVSSSALGPMGSGVFGLKCKREGVSRLSECSTCSLTKHGRGADTDKSQSQA